MSGNAGMYDGDSDEEGANAPIAPAPQQNNVLSRNKLPEVR